MRAAIWVTLSLLLGAVCLSQFAPPSSVVVPPIPTSQARVAVSGHAATYFAATDGSGISAPGTCAIFTADFYGNLQAGNDADGNCLMGVSGQFTAFNGQTIAASGTGVVKANQLRLTQKTVGTLGTCGAGQDGTAWEATDALAPVALAAVSAGGSRHVPVMCDGSNWIVF